MFQHSIAIAVFTSACLFAQQSVADVPKSSVLAVLDNDQPQQEMLEFDLIVTGPKGEPVAGAQVKPWALQSSMGHGLWNVKLVGGTEPAISTTDATGKATVLYPKYAFVAEQIKTTSVSVSVDHPKHPIIDAEHIDVPISKPHALSLPKGAVIEVSLTQDGQRVADEDIFALWTGGRSFQSDEPLQATSDKTYPIPPIAKGTGQFMFVRLDGEVPTHFTAIEDVEIDGSQATIAREVELVPAVRVIGSLSGNVPRPVKNGRVNVQTITDGKSWDEVSWFTWANVSEDGTFVIDAWPAGEPMQLAALCDGFIATSGDKPAMVTPKRARGGYLRAQVFLEPSAAPITVEMTPMSQCEIEVVNGFGKPIEDVRVSTNPNIGWWNSGSQIYASPLLKGGRFLRTRKFDMEADGGFGQPFSGETDENGKLVLELPVGRARLWASNKRYQLPITVGRRSQRITVENEPLQVKLVLQPIGLDVLGDWEDLCGLVFG